MKTVFTSAYIRANKGCYSEKRINNLLSLHGKTRITLTDVLKSKIKYEDKIWFLIYSSGFNREERTNWYNQSDVAKKYFYYDGGVVGFYVFCYGLGCSGGFLNSLQKKQVLEDILKFSKLKSK